MTRIFYKLLSILITPHSYKSSKSDRVRTDHRLLRYPTLDRVINTAARGAIPVYKTTPITALIKEAGLPSGIVALEHAKLRFVLRLKTIDNQHLLVSRLKLVIRERGCGAGTARGPLTRIQQLGLLIPETQRPKLLCPHFSTGCRTDPTEGLTKEEAAQAFKEWWQQLPPEDYTIFSDGSEQTIDRKRCVGYGYAIYRNGTQIASGFKQI
ncbi:hypothetical protein BCON_0404g00010 [Botryotinia convoluta]|uniref:RNase H type-1 domain-containing protein n=1 Tax=Botryotinia convoluta TaxID=54673 RepID=A0A4Z1HK13_9HELO|nr:hypothetical protein BCON_0404g00010 [Botryotinia convoluta]